MSEQIISGQAAETETNAAASGLLLSVDSIQTGAQLNATDGMEKDTGDSAGAEKDTSDEGGMEKDTTDVDNSDTEGADTDLSDALGAEKDTGDENADSDGSDSAIKMDSADA